MESILVLLVLVGLVAVATGAIIWFAKQQENTSVVDEILEKQDEIMETEKKVDREYLESMTKAELKEYADITDIQVKTSIKKSEMIDTILAASY